MAMPSCVRSVCFVLLLLISASPVFAQSVPPQSVPAVTNADGPSVPLFPEMMARDALGRTTIRTVRLPSALVLDGRLDEEFYQAIKPVGDLIQQEPFEGQPSAEKTEVWVFFDDQYVYVSARNWETEPERRVMSDMQRDARNLFNNDHFGVLFDTFHDGRNGYYFYANAQGGMSDGEVSNEAPNTNWNGLWEVRTEEFDGGWSAEFRFPFRSLRFKPEGQDWGINFRRVVRWRNETSYLTAVPQSYGRRGLTVVSAAGTLVGLESPKRRQTLDVKPYMLGSSATDRTADPAFSNRTAGEFGMDAKWGIKQSLVADFTYNTDFAQVEDDEAQINLTRFSVFFPEKREFFLEGQDYFNFGSGGGFGGGGGGGGFGPSVTPLVFYSRRIGLEDGAAVPILGGGRVLGRGAGFQVGALHIVTDSGPEPESVGSQFSVLRLNRDVMSRSRVGLIATRRAASGSGTGVNYAYGADVSLNLSTAASMQGYWAQTRTEGDPAGDDVSYRARADWNTDVIGLQAEHLYVGDDFSPDVGFVRRRAFSRSFGEARYSPRPKGIPGVRKIFFQGKGDYYHDTSGALESREWEGEFKMEFDSSDQLTFQFVESFERLDESFEVANDVEVPVGGYTFRQGKIQYQLSSSRPVSGFLSVSRGGFYGGTITEAAWRGRVEFSARLYAEPRVSVSYVDGPFGSGSSNVFGSRLTYTLSPRMFIGTLLQFQSRSHSLTTNARFRWEYLPGSELFIVYSDGRGAETGRFPTRLENRSLVVKATKLFRW
ncbi:MAG: carbohydrate binding family 9 domain-containing protein [Acidobacteria bacterium]|nr:carbohydrate binding family 9 domain-containing protein [Acidobacteriota bacterium]